MTAKPKIEHRWKPKWHFLDDTDLVYFFCELRFKISIPQYSARFFPGTLYRHFEADGGYYRWVPKLAFLDPKDLCYLSQFIDCVVPAHEAEAVTPPLPGRLRRNFEMNADGDLVWKPDLDWLHISELPHVVRLWRVTVTDERWREGTFPDCLRQHFVDQPVQTRRRAPAKKKATAGTPKRRGRPPGSKNKPKAAATRASA